MAWSVARVLVTAVLWVSEDHNAHLCCSLIQELRELILKYREDIISVRTAADHLEEKLKAEILFLKEQIQAEQYLKENIEETLQLEIENCKEEIGEQG